MTIDNTTSIDIKKGKQVSIESFTSSVKRKHVGSDDKEKDNKKLKIEPSEETLTANPTSNLRLSPISYSNGNSATCQNSTTTLTSGSNSATIPTKKQLTPREQERENRRLARLAEEEKKREFKRKKRLEEDERRRIKKLADEEERRQKREKIEHEKKLRLEQKELEKLEKLKKKEEELKAREEKKQREEEEKLKRREEIERKRIERIQEKQKIELEKQQKKIEEENKMKKRSITNFFKVKAENVENAPEISRIEVKTEFEKYFLPFHVRPNVKINNNSIPFSSKWDEFIKDPIKYQSEQIETTTANPTTRANPTTTSFERASSVLQCLNSASNDEANRIFPHVPLKYFKFYESKKPTYFGTFSYTITDIVEDVDLKLHPCTKITVNKIGEEGGKAIDYEYDSEADIADDGEEDDEEGEDINSGDEDDDDDEDDLDSSDIDEFVETDNAGPRQKRTIGPLTAVVRTCRDQIDGTDEFGTYFNTLRWEQLNPQICFPIDPYADYWSNKQPQQQQQQQEQQQEQQPHETCTHSSAPHSPAPASASAPPAPPAATLLPMLVKKKTISLPAHIAALVAFVDAHQTLSLGTLAELAVKDPAVGLSHYSRAQVKNAIREHAVFDKKAGTWTVSPR